MHKYTNTYTIHIYLKPFLTADASRQAKYPPSGPLAITTSLSEIKLNKLNIIMTFRAKLYNQSFYSDRKSVCQRVRLSIH